MATLLILTFGMIAGGYFAGCNDALFEELMHYWLAVGCIWLVDWSIRQIQEMRNNATLSD